MSRHGQRPQGASRAVWPVLARSTRRWTAPGWSCSGRPVGAIASAITDNAYDGEPTEAAARQRSHA